MNLFGPKMQFNKWREPIIRPSSIPEEDRYREDGTDEWFVTEDGYEFKEGDVLWSPYTYEWHKVVVRDEKLYGSFYGWFDTVDPVTGTKSETLNSSRLTKRNSNGKTYEEENTNA